MKVAKRFRWEGSHRLPWHDGGCKNLHGHSYIMWVEFKGTPDEKGLLIDFKDIKEVLSPLIDAWDHGTLIAKSDEELFLNNPDIQKSKHYILPYDTTSENICRFVGEYLAAHALDLLVQHRIDSVNIKLQETETCYAEHEATIEELKALKQATAASAEPDSEYKPSSALVLFSGGQDSTTCLFWAKQHFERVEALGFRYGQKHEIELQQARIIAEKAGVPFEIKDITGELQGSALTEHDKDISAQHELNPKLPASFVPARNARFLLDAINHAYLRGISDIVGGMCQADSSGYPDCRRDFIDSMQNTMSLALDKNIRIHTPLMNLSKAEAWKLAHDLDVLDIVRDLSHTDYNGDRTTYNEWGYGKLDNPASILRARGYEEAKLNGWLG